MVSYTNLFNCAGNVDHIIYWGSGASRLALGHARVTSETLELCDVRVHTLKFIAL